MKKNHLSDHFDMSSLFSFWRVCRREARVIQKGLTITEMVMYMAIFSLLLLVFTQIFLSALDVQLESKATSSVQQDGEYLLTRLTYDIQRASGVVVPAMYGQPAGTLQLTIGGQSYTYSTDLNNNFVLTNAQGTNNLNSIDTTVKNLSFTRLGNAGGKSTIQLQVTVTSTTQKTSGTESKTFQTTASLR